MLIEWTTSCAMVPEADEHGFATRFTEAMADH